MEVAIWIAGVGTLSLVVVLGTIVWRLASRISTVEAAAEEAKKKAESAALAVIAANLKHDKLSDELNNLREEVAKEYVSYKHMTNLENRLVEAITGLGNRIDSLFSRSQHA
jgi:hypothetical protein